MTHASPASQTLYLVDVSSFIFRAFYGIRPLTAPSGEPVNAVYGVATMLARLNEECKPRYLVVVYDSKEPSFRKEIYAEYKANRTAPPDDLIPQFDRVEQLVGAMAMHSCRQSGIEADDLIATLTHRWCSQDPRHHVVIVTGDKDLMQLVNGRVSILDTMNDKSYGPEEVRAKFGVSPSQIRDYLALVGDSSDNIPGVPGVGPKTAEGLLKEFDTLDGVLQAAREGRISGKKCEVLREHEKDARLSAELATVRTDLGTEISRDLARYEFRVTPECQALLKELGFNSLLERWQKLLPEGANGATPESAAESATEVATPGVQKSWLEIPVPAAPGESFVTVDTESVFKQLLERIVRKGEFGFDLETTSLNPREAKLCGIALSVDPKEGYYIPVGHAEGKQLAESFVLGALKPLLEDPRCKKVGQNLKYDFSVLHEMGIHPTGIGADTMVAGYVLDPEGRHNLQTLAAHYLGYTVMTYEQVCGKGKEQISFRDVPIALATRYSAEDAVIALRLWHTLRPKLEAEGLMRIFLDVDLPLVEILMRMEAQGVCIDEPWLQQLSKRFEKDLARIEERIAAFTQGPVNLNSPKQLAHLLFEELGLPTQSKTKTGFSTDAKVLEALAPLHEVPRQLLEYREISKLKGTYVDTLPLEKDAKTGKIHAGFHQTVAATGRLSSSDPNLQNIPVKTERGRLIRRAFVASPGNALLSADYSQIELRLLAHMSGDEDLCRSFREEEDVHRRTASEIFGRKPEDVDDRQRGIAKAVNFGLMYGKTAFGLAQELKIPRKEAAEVIEKYFKRYRGVKRYLEQAVLEARENGYVTTVLGRKRPLRDIKSPNPALRANAERMAMNTPIQGTAADLMKLAMIELDHRLGKGRFRSKLIIQVHDEVVLDCPKDELETVRKVVVESMESMREKMGLSVPLRANSSTGENWAEL